MASIEMKKKETYGKELKGFEVYPLASTFHIEVESYQEPEHINNAKKRLIETIWEHEQRRRGGKLHEGYILSATSFNSKKLIGHFTPYKYFLAELADPSLKPDLKITPVSMSAITYSGENVIIGKRADWVAEYPGYFELAPAGGVSSDILDASGKIDLKEQLLSELEEETGILKSDVKKVKFFSLLKDLRLSSIEILAVIELKSITLFSSTNEYSQLMSIPKTEIKGFTTMYKENFVPLSLQLLKLQKLL